MKYKAPHPKPQALHLNPTYHLKKPLQVLQTLQVLQALYKPNKFPDSGQLRRLFARLRRGPNHTSELERLKFDKSAKAQAKLLGI